MTLAYHCFLSFLSGTIIEAIYAMGVLFIADRDRLSAASAAMVWGAMLLLGMNETDRGAKYLESVFWCVGLGVGTVIGMWAAGIAKRRSSRPAETGE